MRASEVEWYEVMVNKMRKSKRNTTEEVNLFVK